MRYPETASKRNGYYKSQPKVPILNRKKPVRTHQSYVINLHFNIILFYEELQGVLSNMVFGIKSFMHFSTVQCGQCVPQ